MAYPDDLRAQLVRQERALEDLQRRLDAHVQLDSFDPVVIDLERCLDEQQHTVDVLRECIERPLV